MDYRIHETKTPAARELAQKIQDKQDKLKIELKKLQERQEKQANKHKTERPILEEGDKVYLSRKNIKTRRPSNKLDFRKLGPYEVRAKISDTVYELKLPEETRVHPRFHISLLEPAPKEVPLSNEQVMGEAEYEVEQIKAHRKRRGQTEYLVKWKGYDENENTWEPAKHLKNAPLILERYWAQQP
jgi:hypothetical protein